MSNLYDNEIAFWKKSLSPTERNPWINALLNPSTRLSVVPNVVLNMLKKFTSPPAVLDVGCGPISCLKGLQDSKQIILTGIDPLKNEYDDILSGYGLEKQNNIRLTGERITEGLPGMTFDVVFSRNALDHSQSPRKCAEEIDKALKPGGFFILVSKINEGTTAGWNGLHNWNFAVKSERLICANRKGAVQDLFKNLSLLFHSVEEREMWFSAVWMKRPLLTAVSGHSIDLRRIKQKGVVIDVGANEGSFSTSIQKLANVQIIGFEPLPTLFEEFLAPLQKDPNFKFENAAVGHPEGQRLFHAYKGTTSSSFLTRTDLPKFKEIRVAVKSLNKILDTLTRVEVLKLDCEGAEMEILENVTEENLRKCEQLTVEFHSFCAFENKITPQVIETLKKKIEKIGYYCSQVKPDNSDCWFGKKD